MKAPLKTVLKNFLDHVEDLEKRRKVYDDQYEIEFQELKKLTDTLKEDPAYQCSIGLKDVNRPKNRYKDIVPYDSSRVILPKYEGIPGSDYINASYVKGSSGAFAYIAAQGPLPNTVIDFWRMIWVCDVQVLVMACNEIEAGKHKCEAYWPSPGEVKSYGNISIELVNTSQICPDFLVRTLLVKCGSEMRDVYQFHYTSWPDHGVPETVQPILDLIRLMRDCQASETVPIVVHCSAGCGRTGTICAVDYVWACLRHGKLDEDFSLYQIALELRRQRIAMIQTKEQYILAHKVVASMFEQQLKVIDCHIYENLDEDGEPLMWKEVGKDKEMNVSDFKKILNTKEKAESTLTDVNKIPVERKNNSVSATVKPQQSNTDTVSCNSSVGGCLNVKENEVNSVDVSCKNSESSYSRNSILSQHSNEDSIPFIDDDDVCVRPNCGRAYLNMPSCDSISKIVNCFDPFVDKLSLGTDDSSPDGDPSEVSNKMKDFQSASSKTLDRNAKISPFRDSKFKTESEIKGLGDSKFDILDSAKNVLLQNNRESYPRCSSSEKFQKNLSAVTVEGHVNESCDDISSKKVGKATVVRRPSISKLKALFERSGVSTQKNTNEGSKRLLFRNNSHHVSRAGSAPPSLDCMDRSSAVEKESILKLVTRKFRSSSVRTEREMQSKEIEKTLNRRSAAEAVKDGLNTLSRTVSFSLNKSFKSYSPAKIKPVVHMKSNSSNPSDSVAGTYKPKSPDQPKGNSMWYDKSSLPRAVAVVKPTGKFETSNELKSPTTSPSYQKSPDKNKSQDTHFPYLTKPTKLKELFQGLNKKDSTTLWYNESDTHLSSDKSNNDSSLKSETTNSQTKLSSKVLPFLPIVPWKKVGQKSPLSSPDSPKNFVEPTTPGSSTFYTDILETVSTKESPLKETSGIIKCPVPEEIIPLNIDNAEKSFWPSSSVSSYSETVGSDKTNGSISINNDNAPEQCKNSELSKTENDMKNNTVIKQVLDCEISKKENDLDNKNGLPHQSANCDLSEEKTNAENTAEILNQTALSDSIEKESNMKNRKDLSIQSKNSEYQKKLDTELYIADDVRPAIPKKMVIGKNKNLQNTPLDKPSDFQSSAMPLQTDNVLNKINSDIDSSAKQSSKPDNVLDKNDLYININVKAKKNIEQIENALRKNPRGAIIDLTSRESYSMEEELVNAVNMLDSSEKITVTQAGHNEKSKTLGVKSNPKFPGYEVIWPEQPYIPVQKSKSSSKVPLMKKTELIDRNAEFVLSIQNKTGICYSPPLRRNPNAGLLLAKSQSCSNLDWSEDYPASCLKDQSNTPTKRLVNEAVVELNTLLNQLTTRTLSEKMEFDQKSEEKHVMNKEDSECQKTGKKECNIQSNDTVVDSVTLVTKSYNSGTSPKEEEIVFHFPPPPRVPPPPKDDSPVESFSIICKNGNLVVKESKNDKSCTKSFAKESEDKISANDKASDRMLEEKHKKIPLPTPRQSKQAGALRRSSSYTNIIPPIDKNKGYENIFLDKYQTLSRLQIKSEDCKDKTPDRIVPCQMSPKMNNKSSNSRMSSSKYVNIADIQTVDLDALYKTKQKLLAKNNETDDVKELSKNTDMRVSAGSNRVQNDKVKMIIDENEVDSVYGKIYKISSNKTQSIGGFGGEKSVNLIQSIGERDKKKPAQSKKTAPPPPYVKPAQSPNNGNVPKENPDISMITKKLPSRKLEKAPPPPHLLQKSSSAMIVNKRNLPGPPSHHINFPPSHPVDTKHALPAVHENVPNLTHRSQIVNKNKSTSVVQNKFVNRGLSHSQSDVSVYLALKEHKMQTANQEHKMLNMKSLLANKKYDQSVSSSDSDSSYEKIFLTKTEEPQRTVSKSVSKEQNEQTLFRKEVPVAPPRSKRRSTTEVQYSKVKTKDASHGTPTSRLLGEIKLKNSEINSLPLEEDPPAIPMKTRDAFEIPEECIMAGSEQKK